MRYRTWTPQQEDTLRDLAGLMPMATIARRVGHSRAACMQRLVDLGERARNAQGLLTASVAAQEYGVPVHRIRRWAASGVLPARKGPGYWQIDPEDLERFLETRHAADQS